MDDDPGRIRGIRHREDGYLLWLVAAPVIGFMCGLVLGYIT